MRGENGEEKEGTMGGRSRFDLTSGAYVSDNRAFAVFQITSVYASSNDRREFFVREQVFCVISSFDDHHPPRFFSLSFFLSSRRNFGRERLFVLSKNYATGRDFEDTVFSMR